MKQLLQPWPEGRYVEARQAALAALAEQWNQTPPPFLAGLAPAQVMIGGGPREARLADELLDQINLKVLALRARALVR